MGCGSDFNMTGSPEPHDDWYDTHCPTCDAAEPSHTPTCAVVNLGVGCDVHGNDCAADCVHRGGPQSHDSETGADRA